MIVYDNEVMVNTDCAFGAVIKNNDGNISILFRPAAKTSTDGFSFFYDNVEEAHAEMLELGRSVEEGYKSHRMLRTRSYKKYTGEAQAAPETQHATDIYTEAKTAKP